MLNIARLTAQRDVALEDSQRLQKESNKRMKDYWRLGQKLADIQGPELFFKVGERIYYTDMSSSQPMYCCGYEFYPGSEENYPEQHSMALRYTCLNPDEEPTPERLKQFGYTKYGWLTRFENQEAHDARMAAQSAKFREEMLARRATKEAQNG